MHLYLRKSVRCFLERVATDRYVKLMHNFAIMSYEGLRYSRRDTGLVENRRRRPA
jgi:hypothetical protein